MNDALREELHSMMARDQACRALALRKQCLRQAITPAESQQQAFVDRVNTYRLQEILARYGWPGRALVGEDGANAALLLALHADHNVPFQKECLSYLCAAVSAEDVPPHHLAFLADRICINQGQPQRYGTQYKIKEDMTVLAPLTDANRVNARRHVLGLPPLACPTDKKSEQTLSGKSGAQGMTTAEDGHE